MKISVLEDKRLDIPSFSINLTEQDNNSMKIPISLPLYVGNVGLNTFINDVILNIHTINGDDEIVLSDKEQVEDKEEVIVYWLMSRNQLISPEIEIQIKIQHKIEDICWLTKVRKLSILNSLNIDKEIIKENPTILQQLQQELNNANNDIINISDRLGVIEKITIVPEASEDDILYGRKNKQWVPINEYIGIENTTAKTTVINTNVASIEVEILDSPKLGGRGAEEYIISNTINADKILFSDGESLQDKFNNGNLK